MSMRRQSSCPGMLRNQQSNYSHGGSFMSCAMGDDDNGSISSVSSRQSSFSSMTSDNTEHERRSPSILPSTFGGNMNSSRTNSQNLYHHQQAKTPRWVLLVMCGTIMLSWFRAVQYRTISYGILSSMDTELESIEFQKRQSTRLWKDATDTKNSFAKQHWKLKKTQKNFQHETRMLEEMAELEAASDNDNIEIPEAAREKFQNRRTGDVAKKWIEHRQEALLHKVYSLQAYIRENSRQRVIEKYGYGPHHVVFDVKSREGRKSGKFTVRMAPLTAVPHAVETFMDMVSNKVWDNTVFYYHHSQAHVVAAAPVVYGTFQTKDHELESLGHNGVSFPEYSPSFPHKQHTIGFAGSGPNFYINSIDNEDHHGPGSQGHHELEGDADPCFGEVINGFDTIREMQYARHRGDVPRVWSDYDLTRIIKATLVPLI
ncbi:unnamed protein product [Pseudo-nitzschia multistriata]|uniref:PPIase cyclophilin-type domain-containing protein n=1 Tax=Pseudo-nitzschia multistriata TaxID=183589 RepID=A0A448YZN7_9STRA|nr:unnamed protein product [Pseudo-nitzschia multistriata]